MSIPSGTKNIISGMPGSGDASAIRSDINVTPLVDVCLVLLIIFMVVTPMLQKGVDVILPETAAPEKKPEGAKQLTVAVKADGSTWIEQNWVPKEQLTAQLKDIFARSPNKDVVIKADRRLKYRQVREVMQLINEAGFTGVGLITDKIGRNG